MKQRDKEEDELVAARNAINRLMQNEDFQNTFLKWIKDERENSIYLMAQQKDPAQFHKAQGQFSAFEFLLTKPKVIEAGAERLAARKNKQLKDE